MRFAPLLTGSIESAVRLRIDEFRVSGGPTNHDIADACKAGVLIAERGDLMLHGPGRPGPASDLFNRLAMAVAVLAFMPGGITCFGFHFDANRSPATPDPTRPKTNAPPGCGENHPFAKLREHEVLYIRDRSSHGFGKKRLSRRFGVNPNTIRCVIRNRTWKYLLEDEVETKGGVKW